MQTNDWTCKFNYIHSKTTLFRIYSYDSELDFPKKEDIDAVRITQEDITGRKIFRNKVLIGQLVKGKKTGWPEQFGPMRAKEKEAGGVGGKKKRKLKRWSWKVLRGVQNEKKFGK